MPVLDWVLLAVLLVSLLLGLWRGLVYEVLSVVSWIAAFVLAQWLPAQRPGGAQAAGWPWRQDGSSQHG